MSLVSQNIVFRCFDSDGEIVFNGNETSQTSKRINISINLIKYLQNLLYYDRGFKKLAPPPGGFEGDFFRKFVFANY